MKHVKVNCDYCPALPEATSAKSATQTGCQDWEMHPAWITGMEALSEYGEWVSSMVLPIAFQWIDEHRAEVYATVPEEFKDDVGVVIAAAFKLIKELPAYKNGQQKGAAYPAAYDVSKINPVWAEIVKKIRQARTDALATKDGILLAPEE